MRVLMGMTLMAATILLPALALAQQTGELPLCFSRDTVAPEQRIASCTAQIDSGELSPQRLANAFNARGFGFLIKKQYDRAIKDFGKAIEVDPNYAAALHNRGNAYRNKGQYGLAIADYDRAIALDPNFTAAYFNRGIAYQERAFWDFDAYLNDGLFEDHAIADFDQVISRNPRNTGALNNRANSYLRKQQFERAIADYDEAIRLDPNSALYVKNRGNAYRIMGQRDRAIEDFRKALTLKIDDALKTFLQTALAELGAA
jgi:tetratricopeptide (TPR) repeat protein